MKITGKGIIVLITAGIIGLLMYGCWYNAVTISGDLTPTIDRLLRSQDEIDKFVINAPVDGRLGTVSCSDEEILQSLKEMEKLEKPVVGRVLTGWIYFNNRRVICSVIIGGGADVSLSFNKDWLDGSTDYHLPHDSLMRIWILENLQSRGVTL